MSEKIPSEPEFKDYYKILGVSRDVSEEEIKKTYRERAKETHPDRGGDTNKFNDITEAYQVLTNSEKRAKYDAELGKLSIDKTIDGIIKQTREEMDKTMAGIFKDADEAFGEVWKENKKKNK